MLKFQSATKLLKLGQHGSQCNLKNLKSDTFFLILGQIAKISIILYSPMTAVFIIKFGPDRMKTVGGVAFCNFQPHMVLY